MHDLLSSEARGVTRWIIAVASASDARIALEAGADGVEIADPAIAAEVAAVAAGRASVGFAAPPGLALDAVAPLLTECGVSYAVQTLTRSDNVTEAARRLGGGVLPFALHAAIGEDEPAPATVLACCASAGFVAARLETRAARLLERLPIPRVQRFTAECAASGMEPWLAGRLEAPDIPRLLELGPAALVFTAPGLRGVESATLARLRTLIPSADENPAVPDAAVGMPGTDRVFLHDLVLPVFAGAYGHEEQARQRVRFFVDVDVRRIGHTAADMRDIFSYDLILDRIRLLTASMHWPVLEGLAERLATRLLQHPRAARVTVRIEKLDVAPCTMGVEIVRERRAEPPA